MNFLTSFGQLSVLYPSIIYFRVYSCFRVFIMLHFGHLSPCILDIFRKCVKPAYVELNVDYESVELSVTRGPKNGPRRAVDFCRVYPFGIPSTTNVHSCCFAKYILKRYIPKLSLTSHILLIIHFANNLIYPESIWLTTNNWSRFQEI